MPLNLIFCNKKNIIHCVQIFFGAIVYEAYKAQQGSWPSCGNAWDGPLFNSLSKPKQACDDILLKKQRQQKKQDDAFFKWGKHRHPPYQKISVVENLRT